jgi:hypothetical protein
MRTLFISSCNDNELVNFDNDLEFLFIKQMKSEGKITTSVNLPCTLKALYIEVLFIDIGSINAKTNLSKTDFGIRTILRKKLPHDCILVVNNISVYNKNTYAPKIKSLVFVFGLPDIEGLLNSDFTYINNDGLLCEYQDYEDIDSLFKYLIRDAKWSPSINKIKDAIDIKYTLVNKNIFDTYIVYPSKLFDDYDDSPLHEAASIGFLKFMKNC